MNQFALENKQKRAIGHDGLPKGDGSLVMKDQMEVSPLAREAQASIRSITDRLLLAPSSHTPTPISFPYGSLSFTGGVWAYHVPYRYQ
jgi:hypothetical protein